MMERRRETAAATVMQAWARGIETRKVVSAALEARGLPLLAAEQRRRVRVNRTGVVGALSGRELALMASFYHSGSTYGVAVSHVAIEVMYCSTTSDTNLLESTLKNMLPSGAYDA